jgi:expansin (peptidoglycan-binding protein)
MAAVAHNPAFAKKVGVPTSVGKEFVQADKAKGYSTQAKINRPNTAHGKLDMPFHSVQSKAKGGEMKESKAMMKKEVAFMQKKGAPKSMIKHEKAEAKGMKFARGGGIESRGKTKGKMIKMAKGGRAC